MQFTDHQMNKTCCACTTIWLTPCTHWAGNAFNFALLSSFLFLLLVSLSLFLFLFKVHYRCLCNTIEISRPIPQFSVGLFIYCFVFSFLSLIGLWRFSLLWRERERESHKRRKAGNALSRINSHTKYK